MNILTVCTANICRSPVAHLLLQDRLGSSIVVASGGIRALSGAPMDPRSAQALLEAGLSERTQQQLETFRASALTPDRIAAADLVLTATTEHRDQAVRLSPRSLKRIFTLLEFVQLATGAVERVDDIDSAGAFVAQTARRRARAVGDLDIPDPVGLDPDAYRAVTGVIDEAVRRVVATVRPWVPEGTLEVGD